MPLTRLEDSPTSPHFSPARDAVGLSARPLRAGMKAGEEVKKGRPFRAPADARGVGGVVTQGGGWRLALGYVLPPLQGEEGSPRSVLNMSRPFRAPADGRGEGGRRDPGRRLAPCPGLCSAAPSGRRRVARRGKARSGIACSMCALTLQATSVVTMITRACSGRRTEGSRGRTNPFSTTPATATGRRVVRRCFSIGIGVAPGAMSCGGRRGSPAMASSRERRSGVRSSVLGVVMTLAIRARHHPTSPSGFPFCSAAPLRSRKRTFTVGPAMWWSRCRGRWQRTTTSLESSLNSWR